MKASFGGLLGLIPGNLKFSRTLYLGSLDHLYRRQKLLFLKMYISVFTKHLGVFGNKGREMGECGIYAYTGVCGFFLSVKFATSLLALLAGG